MFCRNCGKELPPYEKICLTCGFKKGTGIKHCGHCGVAVEEEQYMCIKCGHILFGEDSLDTDDDSDAPIAARNEAETSNSCEDENNSDNEDSHNYENYTDRIKKANIYRLISQIIGAILLLAMFFLPVAVYNEISDEHDEKQEYVIYNQNTQPETQHEAPANSFFPGDILLSQEAKQQINRIDKGIQSVQQSSSQGNYDFKEKSDESKEKNDVKNEMENPFEINGTKYVSAFIFIKDVIQAIRTGLNFEDLLSSTDTEEALPIITDTSNFIIAFVVCLLFPMFISKIIRTSKDIKQPLNAAKSTCRHLSNEPSRIYYFRTNGSLNLWLSFFVYVVHIFFSLMDVIICSLLPEAEDFLPYEKSLTVFPVLVIAFLIVAIVYNKKSMHLLKDIYNEL